MTLTGTLPGAGCPRPRTAVGLAWSPGSSQQPGEIGVGLERTGSGGTSLASASLVACRSESGSAGVKPQKRARRFRGSGRVAGDHRVAADPGFGERVPERLQAGREVDRAAARPRLA